MLTADLFYSFRSPYSYIGSWRYRALTQEYDLAIRLRPVYPIATRNPKFFEGVNPLWMSYLQMDVRRMADYHGVSFGKPRPDPIVMNNETLEIAADQPFIRRLTYLGVEAERCGHGLDFCCEVGRDIWGGVENWHFDENLAVSIARAGLDLAEMEAAIAGNEDDFEAEITANQNAEEETGHWGTPCLAFEGEPFFGQDRIDMAVWRMKERGLVAR